MDAEFKNVDRNTIRWTAAMFNPIWLTKWPLFRGNSYFILYKSYHTLYDYFFKLFWCERVKIIYTTLAARQLSIKKQNGTHLWPPYWKMAGEITIFVVMLTDVVTMSCIMSFYMFPWMLSSKILIKTRLDRWYPS